MAYPPLQRRRTLPCCSGHSPQRTRDSRASPSCRHLGLPCNVRIDRPRGTLARRHPTLPCKLLTPALPLTSAYPAASRPPAPRPEDHRDLRPSQAPPWLTLLRRRPGGPGPELWGVYAPELGGVDAWNSGAPRGGSRPKLWGLPGGTACRHIDLPRCSLPCRLPVSGCHISLPCCDSSPGGFRAPKLRWLFRGVGCQNFGGFPGVEAPNFRGSRGRARAPPRLTLPPLRLSKLLGGNFLGFLGPSRRLTLLLPSLRVPSPSVTPAYPASPQLEKVTC